VIGTCPAPKLATGLCALTGVDADDPAGVKLDVNVPALDSLDGSVARFVDPELTISASPFGTGEGVTVGRRP
jgi:hypothetical protein